MNLAITAVLLAATLLLGGCAAGHRIDYRQSVPAISSAPSVEKKIIEVVVLDQRPYVIGGGKRRNFVGVSRALYYNPFNITTVSGMDLSNDILQATMTTLSRQFLNAQSGLAGTNKASSPGHLLLRMSMRDWKNDVYMSARFDYDVTVEIIDHRGAVLASKTAKHRGAINHFIAAGASVLKELLGDEQVVAALTGRLNIEPSTATSAALTAPPVSARTAYDDCMRRVLKITDKQLRLSSMSACDAAI